MTAALTDSAKMMLAQETRLVWAAMSRAVGIASRSEFIKTTSAASMAASAPLPMAAPTSAPASTGASLIPSPTNIALPFCSRICLRAASLSSGSSLAYTVSMPVFSATALALASVSPVSITVVRPACLIRPMASAASRLMVSAMTSVPAKVPSTAT